MKRVTGAEERDWLGAVARRVGSGAGTVGRGDQGHADREGQRQPVHHHRFGCGQPGAFSGGNVAVFITDAGVTLVDTKLPGFGPTILERIKTVTNKPITRIINTHTHGDHTGSNGSFGASVESIVHENTRTSMAKMPEFSGANAQVPAQANLQGQADCRLRQGSDRPLLLRPRAHQRRHFVVFPALRTMHMGDMFAWKALPYVDADNGGSVVEQPDSLAKAAAVAERGHDHQRAHPDRDNLERSEGVRGLHQELRRLRPRLDEGREDCRPGGRRVQGPPEVQGLRRGHQSGIRGCADQHEDRLRRAGKK